MCEEDTSSERIITVISLNELDREIWNEINQDFENNKIEVENYLNLKKQECDVAAVPAVAFLNNGVFPVLHEAIVEMLHKVITDDCFYRPKSTFNGIDFISEFLYNSNSKSPDRKLNWTYIFDMDWVQTFLDVNPRPFYPFHLVWSRDFAAKKIQSFYRAYRERKTKDVQEVRQFWKQYNAKMEVEKQMKFEEENIEEETIMEMMNSVTEMASIITDEARKIIDDEEAAEFERRIREIEYEQELQTKIQEDLGEEDLMEEDVLDEEDKSEVDIETGRKNKILVQKFVDQ